METIEIENRLPYHQQDRLDYYSHGEGILSIIARCVIMFALFAGIVACGSTGTSAPTGDSTQPVQPDQQAQVDTGSEPAQGEVEPTPTQGKPDPAMIQAAWQSSPHADSFVLDANGMNSTCARCHAPVNWLPSIDDMPESCFACKFEIEQPPPLIPETDWVHIPCKVCHIEDNKGNIQPEIAWLEIAQIGEYAEVGTTTELCQKCHSAIDLPEHEVVQLGGAHAAYACTDCHDAHGTVANCGAAGCHEEVIEPATPIPGHDADHQAVSCVACHDAGGMQVGPNEEMGLWTTFVLPEAEGAATALTSHNTVLEAPCERCHFSENPWGLSGNVSIP